MHRLSTSEIKLSGRRLSILAPISSGSIFNLDYKGASRGPINRRSLPNCLQVRMVYNSIPFTLAIAPDNIHVNTKHLDLVDDLLDTLIKKINQLISQLNIVKANVNHDLIIRTTRWLLASTRGHLIYEGNNVKCSIRRPRTIPDGLDSYLASFCLEQLAYRNHDDWFEYNEMMLKLIAFIESETKLSTIQLHTKYQAMARYNYRLQQPIDLQTLALFADHQFGFFSNYDNTKDKRVTLKSKVDPSNCPTPFKREDKVMGHTISIGISGDVRQTSPNVYLAGEVYNRFLQLMEHTYANAG